LTSLITDYTLSVIEEKSRFTFNTFGKVTISALGAILWNITHLACSIYDCPC